MLTGETGAGKSILIDALQIVLGERADSGLIRQGAERCEVAVVFDLSHNEVAQKWLVDQALDDGGECLLRRVITSDGRSRNTINGSVCSLQLLRDLGALLVHIHGQNQHQQLLKSDYQRKLLDNFAQHTSLVADVQGSYQQWRQAVDELAAIQANDTGAQQILLDFQLNELHELGLGAHELPELEVEHKRLAYAEQWLGACQNVMAILSDDEQVSVLRGLYQADSLLRGLPTEQQAAMELLQQAIIQTQEAVSLVRHGIDALAPDPERLHWVEQRLTRVHDMARKHRVAPEALSALQQELQTRRDQLDHQEQRIAALQQQIATARTDYHQHALHLTQGRQAAAEQLSQAVSTVIQTLGMPGGRLQVTLIPREDETPHTHGNERIEYLVSTNPGQPLASLARVVSGGELSRIALAIQVVAAQATLLPTLIFDEVDVGIGGGTAEVVGRQLHTLGKRAQVLCVTHLPQVAAQGDQHVLVEKNTDAHGVHTRLRWLTSDERVNEVARMLGGVKITAKTLAHAREMVQV